MRQNSRGFGSYFIFIILLLMVVAAVTALNKARNDYTLERFVADLEEKKVREVTVHPNSEVPTGYLAVEMRNGEDRELYVTDIVEAEKLVLLTDVRGLLRDPADEATLIPQLQLSSVPALVREGVIAGEMVHKVDCCVNAVRSGVGSAVILDGRVSHALLTELLTDAGVGTMLTN